MCSPNDLGECGPWREWKSETRRGAALLVVDGWVDADVVKLDGLGHALGEALREV